MPEPIENLEDIDRVLRQQGFSEVANLLQEQVLKQENAKYVATIAKLESTIRTGAAKGEELKELARWQKDTISLRDSEIAELKAQLTDRVWVRITNDNTVISAYASEAAAMYYLSDEEGEHVEECTVPDLCALFTAECGLRQLAQRQLVFATDRANKLQSAIDTAERHLEHYRTQGLLGRIFRREPHVAASSSIMLQASRETDCGTE